VAAEQQIQGTKNEHKSLSRAWTGDHLRGTGGMCNGLFLSVIQLRECLEDRLCNLAQSNPSLRKLKTFSFVTIR